MYRVPGIEGLHALRDSLGVIVRAKLPIGRDGRNRPSLFPFCTATGRNAHAKSLYNAHAGMRSFMVFPADKIGVYLDWRTQEVGVAAALSEDQKLIQAYAAGDVYHALAFTCGYTKDPDPQHRKKNNSEMRNQMKRLQLAINYGMGVPSLAKGLNSHTLIASNIIEQHRRAYPRFWQWRDEVVNTAMLRREMRSVFGWTLRISTSPNKRTLYNFPMQANGAEMLRLACCLGTEQGIEICAPVHDAVLICAPLDRLEADVIKMQELMRESSRIVLNGFELGTDASVVRHPDRYMDDRGAAMWQRVMKLIGCCTDAHSQNQTVA
jgi:DNA polymerase I